MVAPTTHICRQWALDGWRWLVSVLMVSEGVDIPRLRVGVYATPARTELFFRQVMGRFVRRTGQPRPVGDATAAQLERAIAVLERELRR